MEKVAFNNEKYLKIQREEILKRISTFGDKLYLEFGGKLFDDFHAERVLPGFIHDTKLKMLLGLKEQADIIIVVNSKDIQKNKNTSILLITHDLALVGENADYTSVMYAGRIIETAPSREFFTNPKHPYSQALLRSLPSNNIERLQTIQGQPPSIQENILLIFKT